MYSFDVYSHPGKLLRHHLSNVAERCEDKFRQTRTDLPNWFAIEHWLNLIWLTGFTHDIGKGTSCFQEYLAEEDEQKKSKLKGSPLTNHALFSSVFAHWIASMYCSQYKIENELWQVMPLFVFLAVKKHHGNLNNAVRMSGTDDPNELDTDANYLDDQFKHLHCHEINTLLDIICSRLRLNVTLDDFPTSLGEYYKKQIKRVERKRLDRATKNISWFYIFQYLYSLLIHSDKEDAIFSGQKKVGRKILNHDIVKLFIQDEFGEPTTQMDRIRTDIFRDANNSISGVDIEKNRIFSLNVPTGTGKTYTSLSTALQLRKRLEKEGLAPRIIYALPFTSIIDQNYEVFRTVFDNPDPDVLLKHHHLADIFYRTRQDEYDTDESKFLVESWESEIIVTTMFQLFHTLFSNKNKMIQKFDKFVNAIVLCDEIQSLPYKYWPVVRTVMTCLSELFHTTFILITATQPRIFEPSEIVELVPKKETYFTKLDRVDITFHDEPLVIDDFKTTCLNRVAESNESFLFVMNTVNSALSLFKSLTSAKEEDTEYYFLATNIIPAHRYQRIRAIKKSRNKKIIVSTQMIEAGVDIDIENVWRDFGPLESINQVCGRCNRNFKGGKKGSVQLFQVLNDDAKNTPFEKYIYGKSPLSMLETKEILSGKSKITESDFLKNMDRYYAGIDAKLNPDISQTLIDQLNKLQFYSVAESFRLIDEENYERKDVFIEIDEKAECVWALFMEILQIEDRLKRKTAFLQIRKDFSGYVISVPAKFVQESEFNETGYVYISKEMLPACYDEMTGWKRETDTMYSF